MAGYGSDDGFGTWLAENGYTAPETPTKAVLRQRGSAYIDAAYGPRFPGSPAAGIAQERAWPRTGATAYGRDVGPSVIPDAVVKASYAAAYYESQNPGGLSVVASAATQVKREKVDVIETEFFAGAEGKTALESATPMLLAVEGLLAPLLRHPEPTIFLV